MKKQEIFGIILYAIMIVMVPMSLKKGDPSQVFNKERKKGNDRKEGSITVNGHTYDGFERYQYLHTAMRMGQVDITKPPRLPQYEKGYLAKEYKVAQERSSRVRKQEVNVTFKERGPANFPGRTRALVIDAADPTENTWFAGSIGGGIWRTTDAGSTWTELTSGLPNIGISCMAQSQSNPEVLYAGTGELAFGGGGSGFNGNGIMKSIDNGDTWEFLTSTAVTEFVNTNRIVVDPNDPNIVLAATTTQKDQRSDPGSDGIYKSVDGGSTWRQVFVSDYVIGQIIADPNDFNRIYASINDATVRISDDAGETWSEPISIVKSAVDPETGTFNNFISSSIGRSELAIAQNNSNIIYASVSTGASELWVSLDRGLTWNAVLDPSANRDIDWLSIPTVQSQGIYGNASMTDPLNDSVVYLAGVSVERFELNSTITTSNITTLDTELTDTDGIIEIWNLFIDEGIEIEQNEFTSVEIRYGVTQKAHRFTVPEGSTFGVPSEDHFYQDYVEVPFQVWDTDNDVQLMVSWRDNNRNGIYDLDDDPDSSREYIFVNQVPYVADRPDTEIAQDGNYRYKNSYLIWLVTPENVLWDENEASGAVIALNLAEDEINTIRGEYTNVASPYPFLGPDYVGPNDQFELHVDHHQLMPIHVTDTSFQILNSSDGGVYLSDNTSTPGVIDGSWDLVSVGYNTTTYYGADKSPNEERYIAGAQDQGTHLTAPSEVASASSLYSEVVGGDGFEALWHATDPLQMIGSSQNNRIARTENGGESFFSATTGMQDDGPFVSRLSNTPLDPDLVFAIGASGVYRSTNFSRSWDYTIIDDERWLNWSGEDVEVSLADPAIVWAGGAMIEGDFPGNIFLSKDGGYSFDATENFGDVGLISGIYSHPLDRSTAYILFAVADGPKVLQTTDLGQTWTDLTQFENGESLNGFPDVAVYSFLVMPYDTDIMWAGTEIGLVQSMDGGASWALLEASDFRSVAVWDMKVRGDEVVLATHGRGIWTATIPELLDAPEPEVVLGPVLSQLGQSTEEFSMVLNYELRDQYDEINIYFNDEIELSIPGNINVGDTTTLIPLIDVGDYSVRIEATKGDLAFRTAELSITISPFFPTLDEYANDFNEPSDDFTLNRFSIGSTPGISSGVLQTVHPYPEGDALGVQSVNLTAKLNIPIRVAEADATISFREIVIVETGEAGTTFEDEEFWDFVVVEGSTDGATWIPFADGYDSSADPDWEAAYAGGANGSDALFRNRTINMLDKFSAGDVVQIRFRLFSDPFANAWGWAIDNLLIQADPPLVSGLNDPEIESAVSIFPNPSFGNVNLNIENVLHGDINMRVIDYSGKQVLNQPLYNRTGKLEQRINLSQLPFGIYVIELNNGQDIVTKKILKF